MKKGVWAVPYACACVIYGLYSLIPCSESSKKTAYQNMIGFQRFEMTALSDRQRKAR